MSESNTITPDEYLDIAGELAAAQREIEKATGRKRAILKRFKDKGGDNDALSLVQKLSRRDTGDRIQLLSNVKKYASWAAITLWEPGGQMAWSLDDNTPQPSGAAVERRQTRSSCLTPAAVAIPVRCASCCYREQK